MSALSLLLPLLLGIAPQDPARVLDGGARQQDAVRQAVRQGRYVPLEQVVADALRRYPGKLVEVDLDDDRYEIEILGANGVVMELDYDARSGRLLKMEED
ncbi:PepSY domain-containing protein [Stenotrophomonas sp. GZD-301]|uniref:PepSY domain-containing protein n=1 Tax=Stenotrophomonas sp. GZD-301 TaxID=3404814 RepID=UPI003BB75C25